ncbi:endonuclease VIII [Eubacteriales bacterium OttesenSCG-928-N13]|nr:endonuclease VIII [Eubacteriales bacterium OttesenSCG-928-N13]
MIELPEAQVLARQMNEVLVGRKIISAEAGHSPHGFAFYEGDPKAYAEVIGGRMIDACRAYAGRVTLSMGDLELEFFDGVNPRYLAKGAPRPVKHQLLLELDDGGALVCTVQMYGGLMLRKGAPTDFYASTAREKPSPLTDAFDEPYFMALFEGIKQSLSAKALLATEQRIPGLGNGVLQDILFQARIHPKAKALNLSAEQRDHLYHSIKRTLRDMTEQGGRDTEKDLFGNAGGYRSILSSKTLNYPCPACGGPITRQAYLGGNVYFCARCQTL